MKFEQNTTSREFDRLNWMIDDLYHEIASHLDLSDSGYAVMRVFLILGDSCTQTEICRYASLAKQTVNSSVKRLERQGLIFFEESSGRERRIRLTAAGEEMVYDRIRLIEEAENAAFCEMTEQEQETLLRITEQYAKSFQEKVSAILDREGK